MRWPAVAALLVLATSTASANDAYSGTYKAAPASVRAEVRDWGPDCGLKPKSYTLRDTPEVKVTSRSGHLFMKFPDRTFRSNGCWSPNPALKVSSSSGSEVRWRTECRTPRGDSKGEIGSYTVQASGPYSLELSEVSAYDWKLKTSHCRATVRITRRLERVASERQAKAPATAAATDPGVRCEGVPGPVAKVRLRPSQARVQPGERVCFRASARDGRGCPVPEPTLKWELRKPKAAKGSLTGGCFRAAELAAEAEGTFKVVATSGDGRGLASINVAALDLSDITAKRPTGGTPPALNPSIPAAPTADPGAAAARVQSRTVERGPSIGLVLAVVAALLALAMAVIFVVRRRALAKDIDRDPSALPRSSIFEAPEPPPAAPAPAAAVPVPPAPAAPAEPMICPQCRTQHAPDVATCPRDGATLLPYSEYTQQARQAASAEKTCSRCGATCAADVQFCGACGAPL